ncbi:MAG: hypothetical protein ABH833_02610 [Parcubacteria group bacterium]
MNKDRIKTFIILTVIIGSLLISSPVHALDGGAGWAMWIKEHIEDPLSRIGAALIWDRISTSVVEKITTIGRDGGPTWVALWDQYAQTAQDDGYNKFVRELQEALYDPQRATICEYLTDDIASMFNIGAPSTFGNSSYNQIYRIDDLQTFSQRNGCTLPEYIMVDGELVLFDVNEFQRDFSHGGWAAFEELSKPQNNLSGLYDNALFEQTKQIQRSEDFAVQEALANDGFVGVRNEAGVIITPGKILSSAATDIINKELEWVVNSDEFGDLFTSAMVLIGDRLDNYLGSNAIIAGYDDGGREALEQDNYFDMRYAIESCTQTAKVKCDDEHLTTCETKTGEDSEGNQTTTTVCEDNKVDKTDCMEYETPICIYSMRIIDDDGYMITEDTHNIYVTCKDPWDDRPSCDVTITRK